MEEELSEREALKIRYWGTVICFQSLQEKGKEISIEAIDTFLNWIIENDEKLKLYGIYTL